MTDVMALFKTMILVQLFYAFAITILVYAMPSDNLDYVTSFSQPANSISLESVSTDVEDSLLRQTNLPLIELGALVFYSGNILIDLLLNFAFAIPQMLGMLVNGILMLINVDSTIFATVELFASVVVMVMYFIGVIQLLTGLRSGRALT